MVITKALSTETLFCLKAYSMHMHPHLGRNTMVPQMTSISNSFRCGNVHHSSRSHQIREMPNTYRSIRGLEWTRWESANPFSCCSPEFHHPLQKRGKKVSCVSLVRSSLISQIAKLGQWHIDPEYIGAQNTLHNHHEPPSYCIFANSLEPCTSCTYSFNGILT
jgi:hypothetical protein